jgi:hypothetical protein
MKHVFAALLGIEMAFCAAAADSTEPWSTSSLLETGKLEKLSRPLSEVFQFNVVDGQLRIDRSAWERTAREIKRKDPDTEADPFAKAQAELAKQDPKAAAQMQLVMGAQRLFFNSIVGNPTPLDILFQNIAKSSGGYSGGRGGGGFGEDAEWNSSFSSESLEGELRTTSHSEQLELTELAAAKRTLLFRTDTRLSFEIRLANRDGDLISLRQASNGRFAIVAFLGKTTFADQRESFAAFVKANRRLVSNELLPALAQFGFQPILSPDSFGVRHAVISSLLSADEIQAEGKRLIADLNSDDYETRERATQSLAARYDLYKDLVQAAVDEHSGSPEAQARLESVVHQQPLPRQPNETAAALDLIHDQSYLASLLDDARVEIRPRLTEQLEKLVAEQHGFDPAAQKEGNAKQSH